MAKNNNLTDFLTDVANAIREKKGTSDPINPQNFSDEIASIETGGGGGGGSAVGAVNFRDYDGTILHSFGKDEFLAMSEMPTLPTQQGLICQGWNYTFEEAKTYVIDNGKIDIGATYITDDGKTRLYVSIPEGKQTLSLRFSQSLTDGVLFDWGDGSTIETISGSGVKTLSHHYEKEGDYVIALDVADGCTLNLGQNSSSSSIMGDTGNYGKVYCNMLKRVEIGKNVTLGIQAFGSCYSLESITIPEGVTTINGNVFNNCFSLLSVIIPKGITSIAENLFYYCHSLSSVVIPEGVTTIGTNAFRSCQSLSSVIIPKSTQRIGDNSFDACYSLKSVVIPQGLKYINNSAFRNCYTLPSVIIPSSVISFGTSVFYNCYALQSVVIPSTIASIGNYAFYTCQSLSSVVIPEGVTTFGANVFASCSSLASIIIPESITTVQSDDFRDCHSLAKVVFPSSITTIASNAFYNCYGMGLYDFRAAKAVPTLAATSALTGIQTSCKIIVPDALYDSWIAASNWSTYASRIVKASEYAD